MPGKWKQSVHSAIACTAVMLHRRHVASCSNPIYVRANSVCPFNVCVCVGFPTPRSLSHALCVLPLSLFVQPLLVNTHTWGGDKKKKIENLLRHLCISLHFVYMHTYMCVWVKQTTSECNCWSGRAQELQAGLNIKRFNSLTSAALWFHTVPHTSYI